VNDAWEPPRLPETTRPRDQTISRLGAGGMAEVFLIRRTGPGGFEKFLALKRIRAGLDAAMFAPMLLDEARLVAALQHPNIVQVHDAGADDDGLWFLMEYVHGRSLGALIGRAIDRGVQVPLECAAYLIACVGRALHYAHHAESAQQERLGVIHRDVSPGNILVGFDGVVKLADFGIARANQRHAETQDGTFKGKYGYAAPEQCRGESLDGASDVFSLGIVLHELLSSRHLFSSDAPLATVEAVLHAPIPSLRELRDDVPAEVDALVRRMLERDRANRASSGAEIANELDGIAHRLGLPATRERMAELMTQLFTSTEMRLQVPAAAQGESLHTPLRAPVLGTPVRPSGSHASQRSAVTAALVEPGSAAGRRLAQSSQPGGEPRNAPGSAIGSQVGAPTSASHVATVAPQPSRDPHPSRKASAFSRIAVTALVGGLSAVGVTLLLREPARPAPPPAPAPAPAVRAPAPVEPVAPTPAAVDPAPAAAAAPAAGSTTPTLDKAGTGTVRRPTKAPRPSHGKPTSSDKRPDAPRSAKKKPGGDESLLERDW
jgi:eukaryotic-like serine/threonine-protein kinase